jgi:hypothetical protein
MPGLNTLLDHCALLLSEISYTHLQPHAAIPICVSAVTLSVQILGFIFIIVYELRYFLTTIMLRKYNIIQTFCDGAIFPANDTRMERRVLTFASVARLNIRR